VSIFNSFDGLKDVFNEINNNEKIEKSPIIFIVTVLNIQPLSQLLKEIAIDDDEIKIINNEQIKMQLKNSIAYINIVKEIKNRDTKFPICKPKERRYKVILSKYILNTFKYRCSF